MQQAEATGSFRTEAASWVRRLSQPVEQALLPLRRMSSPGLRRTDESDLTDDDEADAEESSTALVGDSLAGEDHELGIASSRACHTTRLKMLRLVDSVGVQLLLLVLILFDLVLTGIQIADDVSSLGRHETWLIVATLAVVGVFLLEVALRMFALGVGVFFRHWANVLDLVVTVVSLALEVVVFAYQASDGATGGRWAGGGRLAGGRQAGSCRALVLFIHIDIYICYLFI